MKKFMTKVWLRIRLLGLVIAKPMNWRLLVKVGIFLAIGIPTITPFARALIEVFTTFNLDNRGMSMLADFLITSSTLVIAIGMVIRRIDKLNITDIKSRKLKLALVKNGIKIRKKSNAETDDVDKLTEAELNAKMEEQLIAVPTSEALIDGIVRVVNEVKVATTAPIDTEEQIEAAEEEIGNSELNPFKKLWYIIQYRLASRKGTLEEIDEEIVDEDVIKVEASEVIEEVQVVTPVEEVKPIKIVENPVIIKPVIVEERAPSLITEAAEQTIKELKEEIKEKVELTNTHTETPKIEEVKVNHVETMAEKAKRLRQKRGK